MEGAGSAGGIRARFRSCEQEREIGERSVLGTAKKEAQSEVWAAGGDVRKMHNVLSAASCAPTGPLAKSRRSGHREGVVWRRSAQLARASLYIHTMVSSSRSKTAAASAPLPRGGPVARLQHARYSLASARGARCAVPVGHRWSLVGNLAAAPTVL